LNDQNIAQPGIAGCGPLRCPVGLGRVRALPIRARGRRRLPASTASVRLALPAALAPRWMQGLFPDKILRCDVCHSFISD
jgi:hypothetical protein